MTTALLIAVISLAILVALDLALTMAVIRRLRDHSDRLAALASPPPSRLRDGEPVPAVSAATTAGVSLDRLLSAPAPTPIGFFSAGCDACRTHLPEFLAYLEANEIDNGVVVISGEAGAAADLVEAAAAAPHLVIEEDDGAVTAAFQIRSFPSFFSLRGGQVAVVSSAVRALPTTG